MHLESLLIFLPSLISGIWPTPNSSLEYLMFQVSNQWYSLRNGSHNISGDIKECSAQKQQFVLFETQQEYNAVDGYLASYFSSHSIASSIILIDIIVMARSLKSGTCYSWKNESFQGTIYLYYECSKDCLADCLADCVAADCLSYMEWNSTHFQLIRIPSESFSWRPYFVLCKHANRCQTANCSQDCREAINEYECTCRSGYTLSQNGHSCVDIDECVTPHSPCTDPRQTCVNTQGSFKCECMSGYRQSNHNTCVDINECLEDRELCEQDCVNTDGSYKCMCGPSYTLAGDNITCHYPDECSSGQHTCAQICKTTLGSYACDCHPGFQLAADNHTCDDIDECLPGPHAPTISSDVHNCACPDDQNCSKICADMRLSTTRSNNETHAPEAIFNRCQGLCHNTPGSFYCSCNDGFTLGADKRSCVKSGHRVMLCPCSSLTTPRTMNKSEAAVQQAVKALVKELTVPNRETAYFVRRKTSAVDKRGTAPTNAYIGVVFLLTVLALIVLLDVSQVAHIVLCKVLNMRTRARQKNSEQLA